LIEKMHLTKVIIELDSERLVNVVKKKTFPRKQWGKIAKRCACILDDRRDLSIVWVKREGNSAAHALARWAVNEPDRYWASDFPLCITSHIHKDMEGVT
ncbi:hypothetical protein A2U01_0065994, partial [Trifolium medium]|nr:hypothetical protein [Trifolium medium]